MNQSAFSKIIIAITILAPLACAPASAATVEQNSGPGYWGASPGLGQSFVWPVADPLGIVTIQSNSAISATLRLYAGVHKCDNSGGEFYTQAGNALAAGTNSSIALATPQNLINGSTYTFCLFRDVGAGSTVLAYSGGAGGPYAGGTFIDSNIDPLGTGSDLKFQLDIPAPVVAIKAQPVPTLSECTVLLMTGLLGVFGLFNLRRSKII